MKKLTLKTISQTSTQIFIGNNIHAYINSFIKKLNPTKIVYVTDENLHHKLQKYLSVNTQDILILKPGEVEKNIENLQKIIQFFLDKNIDRKSLVIGFGGGVISDITGFAASIFNRGIPVIFIPTTILAQVDASIGGKNAVNFLTIKNVLGTFYQPAAIFCDIYNLEDLPQKEFASGLAEVIKYGLGFDKSILDILINNQKLDSKNLLEVIQKSVNIKKEIVEKDPHEKNVRKLLNLGHTLGHALESENNLQLTHGEGVAIGLHFAGFLAQKLGNISEKELKMVTDILTKYNLPVFIDFDVEKIIQKIMYDKKKSGEYIDFITLKKIGEVYIYKIKIEELKKYLYQFNLLNKNKIGGRPGRDPGSAQGCSMIK